ncbi:MAG: hypothetical protein ACLU80_17550 [Dorea sp.]
MTVVCMNGSTQNKRYEKNKGISAMQSRNGNEINGTWYYFDEYSIMVSNTIKNINEKLYEFANSGAWIPRDLSARGVEAIRNRSMACMLVQMVSLNTKEKRKSVIWRIIFTVMAK